VRITLVLVALGMMMGFGLALWLNPYPNGREHPNTMGTHTQFGLPPCSFQKYMGVPCPSCGMTTSISLFAHGDILNSLYANCAGTLLAAFCLLFIPWAFVSAVRGRPWGILSMEDVLMRFIVCLVGVMLIRWGIVVALIWFGRGGP
jgi:hypothetical protein